MSENKELLFDYCRSKLGAMGLDDARHQKRLNWEFAEIEARNKVDYFWNLHTSKVRYPYNQNNLLVAFLLGIVRDFDIEQEPNCEYGEYPDIDVDYISEVRDYLKNVWAKKVFGEEYVCNIGNYTTFGIKSALIDMARVHGESREEIQALTTKLEAKDDEGKSLTWDAAMKLYPDLKKYCDEHPDVAEAARRLLNRNRGMGVHAGGLIISSKPLADLVPLVKRKDSPQASAWVEGLHGQDLQSVGLVKFDLLVISNLKQLAKAVKFVEDRSERYSELDKLNIAMEKVARPGQMTTTEAVRLTKDIVSRIGGKVCALPGQSSWSDVKKWRNDPKALAMANTGDLKCIFQFDSEGIRNLVRKGGVDQFEDLVAYTALYRPGPLGMKMHERYVERKRGREKYELHPLVQPILEKTYGVLTYQEQVMKILNVVGDIPLRDCELVRKAISKKKVEGFIKYKEMFIRNGQKNLGVSEAEVTHLWNQIEAFAEYGFNLSHAVAYTYISGRLLYLKAHYPHEFYSAILSCETDSEKIKEYKIEAKLHGVAMHRVDVNKSKVTFDLVGDTIYFGLSNVKGIGDAVAQRIVANQPYSSFEDFLHRFGTDANVVKPLVALRCFRDADPVTLFKFSEYYRDCSKKVEDRKKRFAASMERYQQQFQELAPDEDCKLSDLSGDDPFSADRWKKYDVDEEQMVEKEVECEEDEGGEARWVTRYVHVEGVSEPIEREELRYYKMVAVPKVWNRLKELKKVWKKRQTSIARFAKNQADPLPTLNTFDAESWEIPSEIANELRNPIECEEKYYGFAWIHDLERSPDFKGLMYDQFRNDSSVSVAPVEVKIKKVERREAKKTKNIYYQLHAEDVTGEVGKINIWSDDWERWGDVFKAKDNLLRLRLQPPSETYKTYCLESNSPPGQRWKLKYKSKEEDIRVVVLRPGKLEDNDVPHEEFLAQFDDCTVENE